MNRLKTVRFWNHQPNSLQDEAQFMKSDRQPDESSSSWQSHCQNAAKGIYPSRKLRGQIPPQDQSSIEAENYSADIIQQPYAYLQNPDHPYRIKSSIETQTELDYLNSRSKNLHFESSLLVQKADPVSRTAITSEKTIKALSLIKKLLPQRSLSQTVWIMYQKNVLRKTEEQIISDSFSQKVPIVLSDQQVIQNSKINERADVKVRQKFPKRQKQLSKQLRQQQQTPLGNESSKHQLCRGQNVKTQPDKTTDETEVQNPACKQSAPVRVGEHNSLFFQDESMQGNETDQRAIKVEEGETVIDQSSSVIDKKSTGPKFKFSNWDLFGKSQKQEKFWNKENIRLLMAQYIRNQKIPEIAKYFNQKVSSDSESFPNKFFKNRINKELRVCFRNIRTRYQIYVNACVEQGVEINIAEPPQLIDYSVKHVLTNINGLPLRIQLFKLEFTDLQDFRALDTTISVMNDYLDENPPLQVKAKPVIQKLNRLNKNQRRLHPHSLPYGKKKSFK